MDARRTSARFGMQFVIRDGLHAHNRGHAENIVSVRTARNIRCGAIEAEQNLSVRVGARDVLMT